MPVTSVHNEKELLRRMADGDHRAFDIIYKLYSLRIYRNILRLVKQERIAEEILQDVFMRLWEKRELLSIETSFKSYLFKVAQNLVMDLFRRAAFDQKLLSHLIQVSTELHNDTDDQIQLKDTQALLQEAIDTLSPQRKKIYILCKIEGRSYEEVSKMLGISTSTISDHIVKATRTIKEHFSDHQYLLAVLVAATAIQK